MHAALDEARAAGHVALLDGDTGIGKTVALRAYASLANEQAASGWPVLLYRAEVVNTPRSVVRALLLSLGAPWLGGTNNGFQMLREIIREDGVELIVVDDAQRLAAHSMDILRALHEATGVALALVGTERVGRLLRGKRAELAHRVRLIHTVAPLELGDVLAWINTAGIGRKRRGYWEVLGVARVLLQASAGNFRRVVQIMDAARLLARRDHRAMSMRHLQEAAEMLPSVA